MVSELQDADPRQIGPYSLSRRLGGGGMGLVYLGRSAGGRLVAVKVIRSVSARNGYATKINLQVMNDAVILPAVYSKVLLYRSPRLSNIYVSQYFGMYNYAVLGRS